MKKINSPQEAVDQLVIAWQESLQRKHERHGADFNRELAVADLAMRLTSMSMGMMPLVLAFALDKLATQEQIPGPFVNTAPVPDEIAGLDFDFDLGEGEK